MERVDTISCTSLGTLPKRKVDRLDSYRMKASGGPDKEFKGGFPVML